MKLHNIMIGIAIVLFIAIPIWIYLIVPQLEKMPKDYNLDVNLLSTEQTRYDIGSDLSEKSILNGYIKLSTNKANKKSIFIDEKFHIEYLDGTLSFELTENYEIDRKTRKIIDNGIYYMFPPKLEKKDYTISFPGWDSNLEVKFKAIETLNNLNVYRYEMEVINYDLTSSFDFLDLVPESYDAIVNGESTYWVEPTTGILIKYEESGTNYYVTKDNYEKIQEFSLYTNKFSIDTIANQVRLAQNEKQRIFLIEIITPILLALIGIALIFASIIGRKYSGEQKPVKEIKPIISKNKEVIKKNTGKIKKPLATFEKKIKEMQNK